ncbi:MAG: acyl-CoA/acyl-ACP dehydrogenase [Desulfomonile tiedjei]|nr:acyl-CoA/acyl-ACP dehydrogenase [Desulfomonile tiedjei]
MNFDWTQEELEQRNSITGLLDEPSVAELQALEEADTAEIKSITSEWLMRLAKTGYLALGIAGARRADTLRLIAAQEELACASGSLFLSVETTARLFGGLITGFGEDSQVGDLSGPLQKGEIIAAVAVSEADESNAGTGFLTEGRAAANGYVVTGRKSFVTNGPIADHIAVFGQVNGQTAIFLVQPELPGVVIGPRIRTMGFDGLTVASLELDGVQLPATRVLGPFDDRAALEFLRNMENMVLAVASVGLMERTISAALSYARTHQRGGKAIFNHQEIRFKLAEMLTLSQSSRLLACRAGWLFSISDPEALTVLHCAKVFAAEASERVASTAMQIMAGQGYCRGNVVERGYREAKYAAIAGTTSEIARMSIAEDLLERYKV